MKIGLIALNGKYSNVDAIKNHLILYSDKLEFDKVIGVDGGIYLLKKICIKPSMILGDFDSVKNIKDISNSWEGVETLAFPAHKDYTDAELAVDEMLKCDMDLIIVIGGFGGRVDHMLGALFLQYKSIAQSRMIMIDEGNCVELIEAPLSRTIKREQSIGNYVSIIPLESGLSGITLHGFKYPLNADLLLFSQTRGISNELVQNEGTIEIIGGRGFLIVSKDM